MNAIIKEIQPTDIIDYLKSLNGEIMLVTKIAKHFGVGHSAMGKMLNDLAASKNVRQTLIFSSKAFYIPTQQQLDDEDKASDRPRWQVGQLKVANDRKELYERLQAERGNVKSIG